jgi:hypothetical protein
LNEEPQSKAPDSDDSRAGNARAVETVFRAAFYIGLTGILFLFKPERSSPTLSGVVTGVLLADYITWLAISLIELPRTLAEGGWDALITIAASLVIFNFCGIDIPREDEAIALGFLTFLAVFAVKAAYYGAKYLLADE